MLRRTISSRLLATNKSSSLERFAVQKECPQLLQITKGPNHSLWRCKSTSTTNATFQQHHRQQLQQQQQARILHETLQRVTLRDRLRSFLLKPRTLPIPRWISPRHFTITLSEVCGHASFILVAISYAVDDFLHLRLIAVAGSSVMLCFTYFHPHGRVLWLPFQWNALFIVINSFRIGKTYADRYFAEILSPEMKRVRDRHLYILDPPDFKRMYQLAKVEEYKAGDLITPQGQMNPFVRFVVDGQLDVLRDGLSNYILKV